MSISSDFLYLCATVLCLVNKVEYNPNPTLDPRLSTNCCISSNNTKFGAEHPPFLPFLREFGGTDWNRQHAYLVDPSEMCSSVCLSENCNFLLLPTTFYLLTYLLPTFFNLRRRWHRNLPTPYPTVPSPTLYDVPFSHNTKRYRLTDGQNIVP